MEKAKWISAADYLPPHPDNLESGVRLLLIINCAFKVEKGCEEKKCKVVLVDFLHVVRHFPYEWPLEIPRTLLNDDVITDLTWSCNLHPIGDSEIMDILAAADVPEIIKINISQVSKWMVL